MSDPKKVLYITYDGLTDPLGQSQVLPYLVGLSKKGYRFTLISFEKRERYEKQKQIIEKITGDAGIQWVPLSFTSKPPLLSKIWDVWKMRRKIRSLHQEQGFDLIHCRSYIPVSAARSLCRRKKIPYLFDMRGFWVDERVDNGQWDLKNPVFKAAYRYYKKKEKKYFADAAHVISLTNRGKKELVEKYSVPAAKITVIPCCVDLGHFDFHNIAETEKQQWRKKLGIADQQKIITYLGSLGGWYLTNEMLDFYAAFRKKHPGYAFLFITHDNREKIIALAKARGIPDAEILVQPALRAEVPGLLSLSTWSLFFIKDAYSKRASSPTKQGEIMAMGIPLICNDIGDTGEIVNAAEAGIMVNEFTEAGYQRALQAMDSFTIPPPEKIRNAAFTYFDLQKGIADYSDVYNLLLK